MTKQFSLNCNLEKDTIERIDLMVNNNNDPLLIITFKSPIDQFNLIYKEILTTGDAIYRVNNILRSLNTGIPIKFENFIQYNNLLQSIAKKLDIPYSWSN